MTKKNPSTESLTRCVTDSINQYFDDLKGQKHANLHAFFIAEVERPFLIAVMEQTGGNQTQAAEILGINRNTLKKKLCQYKLL